MPQVSVIVPNYNHYRFLEQRFESIINQSFQDFEIILLDDCSNDRSIHILKDYSKDSRVTHLIVNENNSGNTFVQWVNGLKYAKGEYIWFAESDDYAEPTFLEYTVSALKKNRDVGLAYTDSQIVDINGTKLSLWSELKNEHFKTNKWSYNHEVTGRDEVLEYLLYKTTVNNASAALFKKSFLTEEKYLTRVVKLSNVGDLYTYVIVAIQGNISYINLPLNNCRDHSHNITKINQINGKLFIERIRCYSWILDLLFKQVVTRSESRKITKACKFIIRNDSFRLIDFGYLNEIISFINITVAYGIINKTEARLILILLKMYNIGCGKIRGFIRRTIKYMYH